MVAKNPAAGTSPLRSASGYDLRPLSIDERSRFAAMLTPEEREVILHQGTERPFCGTLLNNKKAGVYACRLCGLPLFKADAKFESGTGWPSFYQPIDPDHVAEIVDESHGMSRTEVRCRRCDGHLGHVFNDGPPPTRQRYCLNSLSLEFYAEGTTPVQRTAAQ
jgi:peptide-methionine (R)-S-oxide reductase